MINYIEKDITTVERGIVAHGVNCQQKMGSGVAKAIRKKWPIVYERYMQLPKGKSMLGVSQLVNTDEFTDNLFIVNCYTQLFYGYGGGKYADFNAVDRCLERVMSWADIYNLPVYLPKIGCGLGGLSWENEVAPLLEAMSDVWIRVEINVCIFGE